MNADPQHRLPLSAVEIAVVIGVKAAYIRKIVAMNNIGSVSRRGRAKLYWTHEVLEAVGGHDRRAIRKRRSLMAHLEPSQLSPNQVTPQRG